MSLAKNVHERATKLLSLKENEQEMDIAELQKLVDNNPLDDKEDELEFNGEVSEEDVDPDELMEDELSDMEKIEEVINTNLSDLGITYSEVEMDSEEGELEIDLSFGDENNLSARIYVEDGVAKLQILSDAENPVSEVELDPSFVNEDGSLNVSPDNFPVDVLKSEVSKNVQSETKPEPEPVQEFFRIKDGIVESFSKKIKYGKTIFEKYKKLAEKKKAKKKAKK